MTKSKSGGSQQDSVVFKNKITKALDELDKLIKGIENQKVYKSVLNEIPGYSLGVFCEEGQKKFRSIYLDNRLAGVSKSDALELTTNLVVRSYNQNKEPILAGILKTLVRIKNRLEKQQFLGDETQIEEFPPEGEIPVIEDDGEDNEVDKACDYEDEDKDVDKAEEGDKKMIFGKPFTYTGGKWEADGGGSKDSPKEEEIEDQLNEEEGPSVADMEDALRDLGYNQNELDAMSQDELQETYDTEFISRDEDYGEEDDYDEEMGRAEEDAEDLLDDMGEEITPTGDTGESELLGEVSIPESETPDETVDSMGSELVDRGVFTERDIEDMTDEEISQAYEDYLGSEMEDDEEDVDELSRQESIDWHENKLEELSNRYESDESMSDKERSELEMQMSDIEENLEDLYARGAEDEDIDETYGPYEPHFEKVGDVWQDTNVDGSQAGVTDDDVAEMAENLDARGYDISQHDLNNAEDVSAIIDMHNEISGPIQDIRDFPQDSTMQFDEDDGFEPAGELDMDQRIDLESDLHEKFSTNPEWRATQEELVGQKMTDEEFDEFTSNYLADLDDEELIEVYDEFVVDEGEIVGEPPKSIKEGMSRDEFEHWVETGEMNTDTAQKLHRAGVISDTDYKEFTGENVPFEMARPRSIREGMRPDEFAMWVKTGKMDPKTAQKLLDSGVINEKEYDEYTSKKITDEDWMES